MTLKLGVIMDPITGINPKKDTTLGLLLAAQAKGFELYYMELADLTLRDGAAMAHMKPLTVHDSYTHWHDFTGETVRKPLTELDVILMRKDPPFDAEYVYATWLLEHAVREGAKVFNEPRAIRDHGEKYSIAEFAQFTADTIVTRDPVRLRAFVQRHGEAVFKLLDGMGGASIFRARADDPNLSVIIETLNQFGARSVMAQRFLPAITDGDKRVLIIGGQVVPFALARIPKLGEARGNLAAGGTGRAQPLSARDREIAESLAPILSSRGLFLVGLDVIGDCLTEINVTSPTCFREIATQTGFDVAGLYIEGLERELARRT